MASVPVCSVIMPVFNAERFLSTSVKSVLAQTFKEWELIIVDDGSTDASRKLAQEWADLDSRIRLVCLQGNQGAAVARNKAIELARGRYLAFLDSDDVWLETKLSVQLAFMQKNGVAFSYSAYNKMTVTGELFATVKVPLRVSYKQLLRGCTIGCLTAIYDRELLGRVNAPLTRKRQDFALWLNILKKVDFAYGIDEPLASYRVWSNSVSANKLSAAFYTWRVYRQIEQLSWLSSCYYFGCYATRGVVIRFLPGLARRVGLLSNP